MNTRAVFVLHSRRPVEARVVAEVFVRTGWTLELTVAGRLIETTPEHHFWIRERGWVEARPLAAVEVWVNSEFMNRLGQVTNSSREADNSDSPKKRFNIAIGVERFEVV